MLILFFFVSFPPVLPRYRFFFNPINYFLLFLQFFSVFFLEKINCLLFFKKLFNNNNYNFQYDYLILSANNFKIIQPTLSDFTLRDLAPLILAVRTTPLSSTESSPQKIDFNQVPSSTLKKSQNECSWTNLTNNAHIEPGNVIYKEVTINNINYRVDDKLLNDDNEKIFSQFKTTPNLFTKIEKNFIPQTDNEYNSNTYENNGSGSVADGYTPKDSQTISNDSESSNSTNSGNFSTKKESSNNFNNDGNGDDLEWLPIEKREETGIVLHHYNLNLMEFIKYLSVNPHSGDIFYTTYQILRNFAYIQKLRNGVTVKYILGNHYRRFNVDKTGWDEKLTYTSYQDELGELLSNF